MPLAKTATLAFSATLSVVSASRARTRPFITVDCETSPPFIFATRTWSVLNEGASAPSARGGGITATHASATSRASVASAPSCFADSTGTSTPLTSSTSRTLATLLAVSEASTSRHLAFAASNPDTISDVCSPVRSSSSASFSSSPANDTTRFVPSPTSVLCAAAAIDTIFAAGWTTSSSLTIVAQSDDTSVFPRWLITSFFIPFGPIDVRTIPANCCVAAMFRSTASSTPSARVVPSFSIPPSPAD
mmetsp:Transcript_9863/g.31676  ORF Transcript_9863/g.31676 Transcript_9863/m.31676 type:complete len:247 (-) Transcript_9863:91-831(-)